MRPGSHAGSSSSMPMRICELAYAEMKTFYDGREPKLGKEKMTLFAFRSYEDYRKYYRSAVGVDPPQMMPRDYEWSTSP